jgi:ribosomal protein S27E
MAKREPTVRRATVKRVSIWITAAVVASFAVQATGPSVGAVVEWEFVEESVSLGMSGVSPHVEKVAGGDRVWRSGVMPAGTAVSLCTDAGACTSETLTATGAGAVVDYTVAQAPSGLRAYFKRIDPSSNTQAVYSAPCTTADCLSFGAATITSTGMQVSKDVKAWGVPDPVRLPDGRVRIYIVESPVGDKCMVKVASYISSDGISFTKESGWRLEGGYGDTEVLRAKDGDWVMIVADLACTASNNQKLFVTTSTDGLKWAEPQVLTGAGDFRFDPTGYEVSTNVFRIYYAIYYRTAAGQATAIKRGIMRIKETPAGGVGVTKTPTATTPASKSKSITCVKGKTVRKVTGTTCPKGFKKK